MQDDLSKRRWLLFVGPPKTGTSWIDRVLRSASGVCLPQKVKETFFFDKHFNDGLHWYFRQFSRGSNADVMAEVGPTYFYAKSVPQRIEKALPNAKIVVSLRDPLQRSASHYLNLRKYGFTDLDIRSALKKHPTIINHSLYANRLDKWFRVFGREAVQVVFFEEIIGHVERLSEEVLTRIGVEPIPPTASVGRINTAAVPKSSALARLGQRYARGLRKANFHSVIDLGKRLGVKEALFTGGTEPKQSELESALTACHSAFSDDREAITELLGRPPPW